MSCFDRRTFLKSAAATAGAALLPNAPLVARTKTARTNSNDNQSPADYTLTIATKPLELAPKTNHLRHHLQRPVSRTAASLQRRPAGHHRYPQRHRHTRASPLARPVRFDRRRRSRRRRHALHPCPRQPQNFLRAQDPQVSASTTPTSVPELILPPANTAAWSAPFTSNPNSTPAITIAKSSSPSKNFSPR